MPEPEFLICINETCDNELLNRKEVIAGSDWFISASGKPFCPEHTPDMVRRIRAKQKERRG